MTNPKIQVSQILNLTWASIKAPIDAYSGSKLILLLVILLNLCITVPLAARLNIWFDESYSLYTTGEDVLFAADKALYLEYQPPLYFVLLNLWRGLNDSILFSRLFSILCISSTIYIATLVSKRFLANIHPNWIAAFIAFHPYAIWAALEIRLYAFSILLSALLLLFFFDGYLAEKTRASARRFYALLSVLALYTNFLLAFSLAANACVLLALKRWQALRSYLFTTVFSGLCFVPIFLILIYKLSSNSESHSRGEISLIRSIIFVIAQISDFVLPMFREPETLSRVLRAIILITLITLFTIFLKKNVRFIQMRRVSIWIVITITSLLLAGFIAATNIILAPRYAYPCFLPAILLALSSFSLNSSIFKRKALMIWSLVVFSFYGLTLYSVYKPMAKTGDWQRVASYIMAAEKPGQSILTFSSELPMLLQYYYSGPNQFVPLPKPYNFSDFALNYSRLSSEEEITSALSHASDDHQYVWLVTDNVHCPAPSSSSLENTNDPLNCKILENFINKHYVVEKSQEFYDSKVELLRQKQHFE